MAESSLTAKRKKTTEISHHDANLEAISLALQQNNNQAVLDMFKLVLQQNNTLKSTISQINTEISTIKSSSEQLSHKLNQLHQQQHNPRQHSHSRTNSSSNSSNSSLRHSSPFEELININNDIQHTSTNIITIFDRNCHSLQISTRHSQPHPPPPPHPHRNGHKHARNESHTFYESQMHHNGTTNGHQHHTSMTRESIPIMDNNQSEQPSINLTQQTDDLSRIINGIENSEQKTEYTDRDRDDSSLKTESITFVTDDHIVNGNHERHNSATSNLSDEQHNMHHLNHLNHLNNHTFHRKASTKISSDDATNDDVLSRHGSKQEIIEKLESGGRILALIKKSESKRVSKSKMIKFLKKKGVSQAKINEAYHEYYSRNDLYEILFTTRPLGFGINKDINGRNAIVTSIQKEEELNKKGLTIESVIYEINGKRVDNRKHDKIINVLQIFLKSSLILNGFSKI